MSILRNIRPWIFHKYGIHDEQFQLYRRWLFLGVSRYESTVNKLEGNPYFEKYSKKLTELKSSDPAEFQARFEKLHKGGIVKEGVIERAKKNVARASQKPQAAHTRPKKLDDILRINMVDDLPAEDVSKLWVEHFRDKDGICAIIPSSSYEEIYNRSQEFPMFLYPLVRGSGYEFIVGQFSGESCYFTTLANFQAYNDNSPVCLTLTHFPELKDTKKIVLMRGEFDSDILNVTEAQFLANQVQIYYGSPDGTRKNSMLRTFNKEPEIFKHSDLITELETLQ